MASLGPPPSSHSSNPPSVTPPYTPSSHEKELESLQATLTKLQSKRLTALRLYQEEKSLRIAESARAATLAAQLNKLSTQSTRSHSQPEPPQQYPHEALSSEFLVSEISSAGLAEGDISASLTWHCLAMAEVLAKAPQDVVVTNEPGECVEDASLEGHEERKRGMVDELSVKHANQIELLKTRLKQAEEDAIAAKKAQQENERLITQLKKQLDESTAACKGLIELVKEQEDTIEKLS